MIQLRCETCGKKLQAKDEHVGKTLKCPNCQSPVTVAAPSPGAPAGNPASPPPMPPSMPPLPPSTPQSPFQPQAAAGQTIVIQVPQQPQGGGMIGPAPKSKIVVWLLAMVCAGLQYFYLGQTGKGILFVLLTLFFWGPLVFITCGVALVGAVPYGFFLLADSMVIAGRMRREAVGPWRFF